MIICDRCQNPTKAVYKIHLVEDDTHWDVCEEHKQAFVEFMTATEKKTLFGRKKKHSAKAG